MHPEELQKLEMGELVVVTYQPKYKFNRKILNKNLILNVVIGYYTACENPDLQWEGLWSYQPWYDYEETPRLERFDAEDVGNILPIYLGELNGIMNLLYDSSTIEEWWTMFKVEALLTHKNQVLREFARKQINNGLTQNVQEIDR